MSLRLIYLLVLNMILSASCLSQQTLSEKEKPPLLICTDIGGDPDDSQSLIRLLLYANDFNIKGLIASASGTRGELGVDTTQPQLIHASLDAYETVWPKLSAHDKNYPTANTLRALVKTGNKQRGINFIGEGYDTEASDWIVQKLEEADPFLHISIWGGQTDLVQALWRIKTDMPREYPYLISKARIYDINDQDGLYNYIRKEFPELFYVLAKAPEGIDKREGAYRGMYLGGDESLSSLKWISKHICKDHGPLGAMYPTKTWTAPNPYGCMKEGDTPSWFFFLKNGLQDSEHPEWGGWGGRFIPEEQRFYRDGDDFAGEDVHPRASVYRWRTYFQNDFQNRMDRCVMLPEELNHAPVVVVNGNSGKEILQLSVKEGETVSIHSDGTKDPDGDSLEYAWWIYPEAGTAQQCPEMWPADQANLTLKMPLNEAGNNMHLILVVSDNGNPSLSSFRRVVLNIE